MQSGVALLCIGGQHVKIDGQAVATEFALLCDGPHCESQLCHWLHDRITVDNLTRGSQQAGHRRAMCCFLR